MAHEVYARARASRDPATRQVLMAQADSLLKEAEKLRTDSVVRAAFPKFDRKCG
jgi:hypothetical protein